jgi:hypothetical protein
MFLIATINICIEVNIEALTIPHWLSTIFEDFTTVTVGCDLM